MPAIPSITILRHRRHPSRLPYGSRHLAVARCRSALTGPGSDAGTLTNKREWQAVYWRKKADLVAVETHTERRILLSFMRSQSASLVRGSSRRIMTVRFRPANIRLINRRFAALNCHLLCFRNKKAGAWINIQEPAPSSVKLRSGFDRSLHIRWMPNSIQSCSGRVISADVQLAEVRALKSTCLVWIPFLRLWRFSRESAAWRCPRRCGCRGSRSSPTPPQYAQTPPRSGQRQQRRGFPQSAPACAFPESVR
jgi:hypothetical protein